jgi:hypothetical protein
MTAPNILEQLGAKGANISAIAGQLIRENEHIPKLVEAFQAETSSKKFAFEKVLRLVSESQPELIYPYFDVFIKLLDSDNSFLKWGSIITIANLTATDTPKKFEAIFSKYYAPISGPTMITAANIIVSSATIARFKPSLIDAITREILKVEKAKYKLKGCLSPECRNVAIGHAIDSFDKFYDQIEDNKEVLNFVKRQLKNTRKQVAKKAEQFLRKHSLPAINE